MNLHVIGVTKMLTEPDFLEKKIIVVYQGNGEKILFQNDNIVVKDSDNKIKFQLSCYRNRFCH